MSITPISQSEINQGKVASLPARPNASTAFGGAGYSSLQLREAFDRLPLLAINKLNELLSALSKAPGEGSLADEIFTAKTDTEGNPYTLSQLFSHIIDGTLATYLLVGEKPLDVAISEVTPLQSPAFTGEPTAPTPSAESNSDRIATTAFVYSLLSGALHTEAEKIKTTSGDYLRFFVGTQQQYEAIEDKNGLFAIITDDRTKAELLERLQALEGDLADTKEGLADGNFHVEHANYAQAAGAAAAADSATEAEVAYAAYVAEQAHEADYATTAGTAEIATRAYQADSAAEADIAFQADSATKATNTSFSQAEFQEVTFTSENTSVSVGSSGTRLCSIDFSYGSYVSHFTDLICNDGKGALHLAHISSTSYVAFMLSIEDGWLKIYSAVINAGTSLLDVAAALCSHTNISVGCTVTVKHKAIT